MTIQIECILAMGENFVKQIIRNLYEKLKRRETEFGFNSKF